MRNRLAIKHYRDKQIAYQVPKIRIPARCNFPQTILSHWVTHVSNIDVKNPVFVEITNFEID